MASLEALSKRVIADLGDLIKAPKITCVSTCAPLQLPAPRLLTHPPLLRARFAVTSCWPSPPFAFYMTL